jgi:hypothetical protein
MSTPSNWTHAICVECWNKRHPDRPTAGRGVGASHACCFCARPTSDGIYVRESPANVSCRGRGAMHEDREPAPAVVPARCPEWPGAPTTDVELVDACAIVAWQEKLSRYPMHCADAVGGVVPLTRVWSYGRQAVWPGDPDDVAAFLSANGFRWRLRRAEGSRETLVEVVGRLDADPPPTPAAFLDAMNRATLARSDLAWVLRRFAPGQRVCATSEITYGTGQHVAEGTLGTVIRMEDDGTPVVRVLWDGFDAGDSEVLPTSCEFVDGARQPDGNPA